MEIVPCNRAHGRDLLRPRENRDDRQSRRIVCDGRDLSKRTGVKLVTVIMWLLALRHCRWGRTWCLTEIRKQSRRGGYSKIKGNKGLFPTAAPPVTVIRKVLKPRNLNSEKKCCMSRTKVFNSLHSELAWST